MIWFLLRPFWAMTTWAKRSAYRKELARLRSCGVDEVEAESIARYVSGTVPTRKL